MRLHPYVLLSVFLVYEWLELDVDIIHHVSVEMLELIQLSSAILPLPAISQCVVVQESHIRA